jgi:hypothetical protein
MAVTLEQVLAILMPEEPDYPNAASLGADALPYLKNLANGSDLMLASKSVYLASLIQTEQSTEILQTAAQSENPIIRVAAAAGIRNLNQASANQISLMLLDDADIGVQKVVLKSLPTQIAPQLRSKLETLTQQERNPLIRQLSTEVLNRVQR